MSHVTPHAKQLDKILGISEWNATNSVQSLLSLKIPLCSIRLSSKIKAEYCTHYQVSGITQIGSIKVQGTKTPLMTMIHSTPLRNLGKGSRIAQI